MTTLMLFSVSAGYDFPLVLIPVTWIVPVVSNFHGPKLSMRRVIQVLWGYIVSGFPRPADIESTNQFRLYS
jgi:hypothetical protein